MGQAARANRRLTATFSGLSVALGGPVVLNLLFGESAKDQLSRSSILFTIVEDWILALGVVGIVLLWERLPITFIGIKKLSKRDWLWVVISFVAGIVSFILTGPLVKALGLGGTTGGIAQLAQTPLALRIGLVITAGMIEEILFRGYPIERLSNLTGRPSLSAIMTYIVFVLLHLPFWGLGGAIQIGVWSIVITVLYVKRRNLLACMLVHILNNAYAFILLPTLFTLTT